MLFERLNLGILECCTYVIYLSLPKQWWLLITPAIAMSLVKDLSPKRKGGIWPEVLIPNFKNINYGGEREMCLLFSSFFFASKLTEYFSSLDIAKKTKKNPHEHCSTLLCMDKCYLLTKSLVGNYPPTSTNRLCFP